MPPLYEDYQQSGYGQYGAFGQAQMAHASNREAQAAFPIQQQQPMNAPSVSNNHYHQPNQQSHHMQPQWQHPQPEYNFQQYAVPPPHHPHQNYHLPQQQQQQIPQYQQSSPLQQFAAGQLQDPVQQQYWPPPQQGVDYQSPYQLQQSQPVPGQFNGQSYRLEQHAPRQPSQHHASSPVTGHHEIPSQTQRPSVNRPISQQQPPQPSHFQQPQYTPSSQRQHSVSSRPPQITPALSQRPPQGQQHQTPTQPSRQSSGQQQPHQPPFTNGTVRRPPATQHTQTQRQSPQSSHAPQSNPNSRTLTHVEIPAYRPVDMTPNPQGRSTKRRRSNEGASIQVNHHIQPQKQQPPPQAAYVQIPRPPESSPLTELASSQVVPPTPSPDVDYQSVLLLLSDEYITSAHSMSPQLCSPGATEDDLSQYHTLIATALGCLESVIANFPPRDAQKEARVRLKFASLLFEETENMSSIEECLAKGIAFCELNKLTDSKYAMQHLLVRAMFKTNPVAAIKTLEKLIKEVESWNFDVWIYAMRFLRVSLSVQSKGSLSDTSAVLRHLAALNERGDAYQHPGVQVAAATLDALIHLQSGDSAAAELASRSLASARTHQLGPVMTDVPQLRATLDLLDVACDLMQSTPADQVGKKLTQFHDSLDAKSKAATWTADGGFSLPLGIRSTSDVEANTGGVLRTTPRGEVALSFMWLSRTQLYMIGFWLGGFSRTTSNPEDRKSETLLTEGLKLNMPAIGTQTMSMKTIETMSDMQQRIAVAVKLLRIFAICGRAAWAEAPPLINSLCTELAETPKIQDDYTAAALLYLSGVVKQASGDELAALEIYRSPELLPSKAMHKIVTPMTDLQALAALNSVSIMRFKHVDAKSAEDLLADIGPYCESHSNKAVVAAYHVLRAHSPEAGMTIIKVKQCLQAALAPAQAVKHCRIMAIILNTMTAQFFEGIVGRQALGSANAGRMFAGRAKDSLWMSVAEGLYRDTALRMDGVAEATDAETKLRSAMSHVPDEVRAKLR